MGDYQLRMGQARQAVASYFRALDLDPDHGPTHAGLARAWLELGQLDEVEVHLDAAAAAGEDVVEWRARLAWRRGVVAAYFFARHGNKLITAILVNQPAIVAVSTG